MSRLPWFPFYPADWFRDTRCLSCAAKGVWIDLLGILWDSKPRGKKTLDMQGWATELGKPIRLVDKLFKELVSRDICEMVTERNKIVTVMSRRQIREEKARQSTRSRVSRFRQRQCNTMTNGSVTVESQSHISESESEDRKKREEKKDALTDAEWMASLSADPTYQGIDIQKAEGKCRNWCKVNRKFFTRKRFINWLNREDQPLSSSPSTIQNKCYWSNDGPCQEYALRGSKYCQAHKEKIAQARTRAGVGSA
jgi:uncharacterized protein YdaU (DUF1376 family)